MAYQTVRLPMEGLGLFRWATAWTAIFGGLGGLVLIGGAQTAVAGGGDLAPFLFMLATGLGVAALVTLVLALAGLATRLLRSMTEDTPETSKSSTES